MSKPTSALELLSDEKSKLGSIDVEREDNVRYDVGNLALFDPKAIDTEAYKENPSEHLKEVARDNVQLLFHKVFLLPKVRSEGMGAMVSLPLGSTPIPREKPLPRPRPKTKWEKFAKEKGIKKRKKDKFTFDEISQEYKPTFGYGKAKDDLKDWLLPVNEHVPQNPDYEDPFHEMEEKKKKRTMKQRENQAANKEAAKKAVGPKLPGTISLTEQSRKPKEDIDHMINIAQRSTISVGKFDKLNKGEKSVKEKRIFAPLMREGEKDDNLKTLKRVFSKIEGKEEQKSLDKLANKTIHKRPLTEQKRITGVTMRKGFLSGPGQALSKTMGAKGTSSAAASAAGKGRGGSAGRGRGGSRGGSRGGRGGRGGRK